MPAADRTAHRHDELPFAPVTFLPDGLDDLGDNIPTPLHQHHITYPDVLLRYLVLGVEGGPGDSNTCKFHRLEKCYRRQCSRPSHLYPDAQKPCCRLLCLELVGDGPSRVLGGGTKALLERQGVHLDDRPVDLIIKGITLLLQPLAVSNHLIEALTSFDQGVHVKAQLLHGAKGVCLCGQDLPYFMSFNIRESVDEHIQRPRCRYLRVKLANTSSCCVPGVGKE